MCVSGSVSPWRAKPIASNCNSPYRFSSAAVTWTCIFYICLAEACSLPGALGHRGCWFGSFGSGISDIERFRHAGGIRRVRFMEMRKLTPHNHFRHTVHGCGDIAEELLFLAGRHHPEEVARLG